MREGVLIAIVMLFFSCVGEHVEDAVPADQSTEISRYFPHFPDQHFEVIKLGESTALIEEKLIQSGYEAILDQPGQFRNDEKQLEVILPESTNVNSFRVFLYRENDIADHKEFINYFSNIANNQSISDEFSVFDFETLEQDFSISIFKQPDFLRLNYELKTSH